MTTTQFYRKRDSRGGEREAITERILRGLDLFRESGEEIRYLSHGTYSVPSCSESKSYKVTVAEGNPGESCTCQDFRHHGGKHGLCKHTVALLVHLAKRPVYRVEEAPTDVYGGRRYRVNEYRLGEFVRCHGERPNVGDAYLDKLELEGMRGVA